MNVASIDIGSNTVIMLIANVDLGKNKITPLLNLYRTPRIGSNLSKSGIISKDSEHKLLKVLDEYNTKIEEFSCAEILCTATKALRSAENSDLIIKSAEEKTGIKIEVISGEREAEYSFFGSVVDYKSTLTTSVIDIGGGSTEIIMGNTQSIKQLHSFNFGSVSLTEKFISNNPPTRTELENLRNHIMEQLNTKEELFNRTIGNLIAVAGTPTTLSAILQNLIEFDESKIDNSIIHFRELEAICHQLSNMTSQQILERYGKIVEGREDVITTGAIILKTILQKMNSDNLLVSTKGLRYGAIVRKFFHSKEKNINQKRASEQKSEEK